MPAERTPPPLPPEHVVLEGIDGARLFAHSANYWRFLADLVRARRRHGVAIHAYVLLPDRVELLVTPSRAGAGARMLRQLGAAYVRWFNRSTGRRGPLWRSRRQAPAIRGDVALLQRQRELELAPVRAGLAEGPGRYRWSSYRHNALGDRDPLISLHPRYLALGPEAGQRQRAYVALGTRRRPAPGCDERG